MICVSELVILFLITLGNKDKKQCFPNDRIADECLKHSYYTRVGFSFSCLFYSNFIVFVARLLN